MWFCASFLGLAVTSEDVFSVSSMFLSERVVQFVEKVRIESKIAVKESKENPIDLDSQKDTKIRLLVVIIVKSRRRLPRKPRFHFNPRMVDEAKIVDIEKHDNIGTGINLKPTKQRQNQITLIQQNFQFSHCDRSESGRRMISMVMLVKALVKVRRVPESMRVVGYRFDVEEKGDSR